jgi:integrase
MLMRIKGIKPVTVRKSGKIFRYYYHRATGARIMAIFGTADFAAEVARRDDQAKSMAPRDGSLKALIVAYRKSPEFTGLAPRTRIDYDRIFDYLAPLSDMPLIEMDAGFIYDLRDKAFAKRKRRFANYVVQVMRLLMAWGKPRKFVETNFAAETKSIKRPKKMPRANRPWDDDERETVLVAADIGLRTIIALGMFAGLRETDACELPKSAYNGERIESIASKNSEPLWIPTHFRLREILKEAEDTRKTRQIRRARRRKILPFDPLSLAVNRYGQAWTASGFRASFFKLVARLETEGRVRRGLTFHGLRHTMGKLVIEAGGAKEDVAMILGDRSMAMAEFYSRQHDKKGRTSAMMLLLEQSESGKMKIRG